MRPEEEEEEEEEEEKEEEEVVTKQRFSRLLWSGRKGKKQHTSTDRSLHTSTVCLHRKGDVRRRL